MTPPKTYDEILERVVIPVRQFLARELEHGVVQVTVAQIRQVLNQLGGRPSGFASNVLTQLQREGTVREVVWAGRDGIVYLTGGEDEVQEGGRVGVEAGHQAGGEEG